jgi:peptidoglycan/LPS O-acetylase OafA/YrhL
LWSDYFARRIVRLWLVLLPALAAGTVWDAIGSRLHAAPALYAGLVPNHTIGNLAASFTAAAFLGNIVFLQTILVAPFGSNGALWSLANEFWYYVLFPILFCAFRKDTSSVRRVLYLSAGAFVCIFVGRDIVAAFPIWLLGALLYQLPIVNIGTRIRWLVAVAYTGFFFAMCLASRGRISLPGSTGLSGDYILAVATVAFLWVLLGARGKAPERFYVSTARITARFSYSLYLAHTPFLVFMTAILAHDSRWQLEPGHFTLALAVFTGAIIYSLIFASLTEFHTDSVRSWVVRRFAGNRHGLTEPL